MTQDRGMAKRGRSYLNQSVSFPPALLAAARKRSGNLGLSFSAYVQKCLEKDLEERGTIVFREFEGTAHMVSEPPQARPETKRPRKTKK
jgi:hypothetical protein